MTDTSEYVQICQQCGSPVDSSGFEPLSRVACPECGGTMIVSNHIAHYELLEVVGRGGMGVVYKARDTSLDRMVALKVLRKDHSQNAELVSQLETEAAVTASINHPHVVRVFTTGTDNGRFYIAMELVDKGTLDDLIGVQGQVAEAQVLEIATQIAQGLRAAYQHGLIHRDVKPGNILFADSHTAKIVDFGLAMLEAAAVGGGEIWGTPYYVAPEKLDQKPEDFRSDMYSFGATLFHALAGRPPFEAKDASRVALKHLKSQAVSLQAFAPHVSSSTAYVINRTLLKEPDQRYQSYDELIEHLQYARAQLEGKGSQVQAKQRVVLETDEDRKIWSYVTFGMLGVAVLIGVGALIFSGSGSKEKSVAAAPQGTVPSAVTTGAGAQQSSQYQAARRLLEEGQPAQAASAFKKLAADSKTPPAMAQWSLIHAGLAELLANRAGESRAVFAQLLSTSNSSETAATLRKIAQLAADDRPVAIDALKDFSRDDAGALAPLIIGLKNWNLEEFDDAGAMLRQFQTSSPRAEFTWISEYKSLIADHLSDYSDYRGAAELLKMASDEGRAEEMLARTRKGLRTQGALGAKFDRLAVELRAQREKREKEAAVASAADREAFEKGSPLLAGLAKDWKFSEAREQLFKTLFATPTGRQDKAGLLRKLDDLDQWKSLISADINATPGRISLAAKAGMALPGPAVKATADGVEIQGGARIHWRDIAPASLIAAATTPGKPGITERALVHRRYLAGVFAAFSGDADAAEKLLNQAAAADPSYTTLVPLSLPSARPGENLTKGKKVTASGYIIGERTHPPGNAIDGDRKTKWAAMERGSKWIQVDLGSLKKINYWMAGHASSGIDDASANTANFEFQTSLDGQDWTTIDRLRENRLAITARSTLPTEARYVRLYITKPGNYDDATRITEFSVHGPDPSANADIAKKFFEPAGLFPGPRLTGEDIGFVGQKGGMQIDSMRGELTLRATGADIWEKGDSFYFAQQRLTGDGEIVARVVSVQHVHEWSKCGLMIRSSLAPDAANAFVGVSPLPRSTVQSRVSNGEPTTSKHGELPAKWPIWLKLVRQGNKFTGFSSQDTVKWNELGSVTVPMPADAYIGLAYATHDNSLTGVAVYDFISIRPYLPPGR